MEGVVRREGDVLPATSLRCSETGARTGSVGHMCINSSVTPEYREWRTWRESKHGRLNAKLPRASGAAWCCLPAASQQYRPNVRVRIPAASNILVPSTVTLLRQWDWLLGIDGRDHRTKERIPSNGLGKYRPMTTSGTSLRVPPRPRRILAETVGRNDPS